MKCSSAEKSPPCHARAQEKRALTTAATARAEADWGKPGERRKGESPAAAEPSPVGLAAGDDDAAFRDGDLEVIGGFEPGGGEPEAAEADVGDFAFVENDGLGIRRRIRTRALGGRCGGGTLALSHGAYSRKWPCG